MKINYIEIIRNGIWGNNIVFGQMLALCPLLAVTTGATNGLGMGLASTAVLTTSNVIISSIRDVISPEVRIPVYVLLIAALVTLVDMAMNAWLHDLHKVLGLFIPLIVTNCAVLGRAESFASRQPILASLLDGLMMGLGFTLALVLLGACREILGSGTLFAHASLLLGDPFQTLEITIIPDFQGILLILLPPGGFLVLGFLLSGKRLLDSRLQQLPIDRKKPAKTEADGDIRPTPA